MQKSHLSPSDTVFHTSRYPYSTRQWSTISRQFFSLGGKMFFSLGPGRITFFPLGRKTGIRRNSILGWQSTMGTWKHTEFVYCTHLVHFSGLFWRSVLIFQLNFSFSKSFCASNLKLCIFPFEAATRWLRTPPLAASHGKIHSFKLSRCLQQHAKKPGSVFRSG